MSHTAESIKSLDVAGLFGLLASADKSLRALLEAEMKRRMAPVASPAGAPVVDYNASGGIFIQEEGKNTRAASGNLYAASANMPISMARLICSDDPVSVDLRRRVMALLDLPADERDKIVEGKSAKKSEREAKELAKQRNVLAAAVKAGSIPKTVLDEFDAKHKTAAA